MTAINLTLAFLLELIAFFGFASIGFLLPVNEIVQGMISIALFGLLITFWGLFMSPKATKKVNLLTYYVIKSLIYTVAAFAIFRFNGLFGAIVFFALFILNDSLLLTHNRNQHKE